MSSTGSPAAAIVYGTVLYDQSELLRGVRDVIGEHVPLVGASSQGISRKGDVQEIPRAVGVALLSVPGLSARVARVSGLGSDARAAGRSLAEIMGPEREGACPMLLWYDPLTGADAQELLDGLAEGGLRNILGGAAGQPWGPLFKTFQYCSGEATTDSIVAMQLDGPVELLFEMSHGTEPLGLELEVTRSHRNHIQEIDGRPALDVWLDTLGGGAVPDTIPWAIGVRPDPGEGQDLVARAVYGIDEATRELVLGAPIRAGSRIHLCHRTRPAVFDGALDMARRLRERMTGRDPIIALSFECAARPRPFLGDALAKREVCEIQQIIGEEIPWLGCYAWGEIAPVGGTSWFHNYTFPLSILASTGG